MYRLFPKKSREQPLAGPRSPEQARRTRRATLSIGYLRIIVWVETWDKHGTFGLLSLTKNLILSNSIY